MVCPQVGNKFHFNWSVRTEVLFLVVLFSTAKAICHARYSQNGLRKHSILLGLDLKLLADKINDFEALKDLEELRLSFSDTDQVVLTDKLQELTQSMNFLDEGLRKHFEDEDKLLPGMLGAPLAQALSLEHRQIIEEIT